MSNWTTSISMLACKTGHAVFSMQEPVFPVGQRIRMVTCHPPFAYMEGIVSTINGNDTSAEIDLAHGDGSTPCGPWFVMVAGEPGVQGPSGNTGETGPQGLQGPIGQGTQGLPGPEGQMGLTGQQGPQGVDGQIGPAGPQGTSGIDGVDGSQGPQGPIGIDGPQGHEGSQGTHGLQGPQGECGPQGSTGPQGVPGRVTLAQLPQAGMILVTYIGVSKSKQQIGHGLKTFIMQPQDDVRYAYATGSRIRASRPFITGQWMEGQVVYYVPGSLEVAIMVDLCSGEGAFDNWVLNLAGQPAKSSSTWGLNYMVSNTLENGKICISSNDGASWVAIGKLDGDGQDASAYVSSLSNQRLHLAWEGGMSAYLLGPNANTNEALSFHGSCVKVYGNDPQIGLHVKLS